MKRIEAVGKDAAVFAVDCWQVALADLHGKPIGRRSTALMQRVTRVAEEGHLFLVTNPGFGCVIAHGGRVSMLAVMPDSQGLGIGARLLDRAEDSLAEQGWSEAFLEVASFNIRARDLYLRRSWKLAGPEYTAADGELTMTYRKTLS